MMALAAIVSFASCSSEDDTTNENESATKIMTFTATQEGDSQSTRAAISATDSKVINWEENDKISIFDGSTNNSFALKSGAGEKSATFEGEAETADSYTAVYPYQSDATLSGTSVDNVTLKATQTATDNSFDKEAALMMAVGDKNTLVFKNVVGFVKVKPLFNCSKIELKAFDNSAILAGTGKLSYNDGNPTLDLSNATIKDYAITLEGDIEANNYYYIAVPPVTLKAGWTIKFTATDGTVYSRKGTKDITFTRSQVTNLGEFATGGEYWYNPRGEIVTAEQEVDMGLTITIGTKSYKVIFAKSNLTATGIAENEYDNGDNFAWAATEPWYSSIDKSTTPWTVTWKGDKTDGYAWSTVPYRDGSNDFCSKYTSDNTLEMKDDAANTILGGDWQLPTKEIWNALHSDSYSWLWTTIGGINGYEITSNSNHTLFLPACGSVTSNTFYGAGNLGDYWSGTAESNTKAYYQAFNNTTVFQPVGGYIRPFGFAVRPVRLVTAN